MIELEKRKCIIFKCSNEFKVMKESDQVTCSEFCLVEYNSKYIQRRKLINLTDYRRIHKEEES